MAYAGRYIFSLPFVLAILPLIKTKAGISLFQILRLRKLFKNYSFDKFIIVNGSYPGGKACISACIAYGLFKKNIAKPILNIHAMTDLTVKNLSTTYKVQNFIIDILIKYSVKKIISCSTAVKDSLYSRKFINNLPQTVIHNGITNITKNQIVNSKGAFIAQLGERQTEDLKVPRSIRGEGMRVILSRIELIIHAVKIKF